MTNSMNMFDYILLAMGLYVLISGIRGKGRLYTAENIKEGMEEKFHKTMQVLYIILGAVMTVNGVVSILKYTFYEFKEVVAATETATAVYEWVPTKDLGAFRFLTVPVLNVLTFVCMGLCLACIIYMIVAIRKMTDKNAPKKQQAGQSGAGQSQASRQAGHILPVSAFDFDEPEETEPLPEKAGSGEARE